MSSQHWMMKYMQTFQCVGSDCEMSCCVGWTAALLPGEANQVRTALQQNDVYHDGIKPVFQLMEETQTIPKMKSGHCVMLTETRTCGLQAQCGESALPNICSMYPRQVQRYGRRLELSAKTSCPEIARILLLSPNATERVPLAPNSLPRSRTDRAIDQPNAQPWTQHLDEIRNMALDMLSLSYPTGHCLFFLTEVAQRLRGVLELSTERDPGMEIQKAIAPLLVRKNLGATHEHLNELNWTGEEILPVVLNLLTIRAVGAGKDPHDPIRKLYTHLCSYNQLSPLDIDGASRTLWPKHQARCAQLQGQWGDLMDRFARRYAQHYWCHEWFPQYPSLVEYVLRHLLLHGMQRVLLVNHPDVAYYLDKNEVVPRDVLENTAVWVLAKTTRSFEHLDLIHKVMDPMKGQRVWSTTQKLCFL